MNLPTINPDAARDPHLANAFDAYASSADRQTGPSLAGRRRWPLLVIGASAGTATWSGWVGLGELTGFGVVRPLPGIWDSLTINSAITLPVGVEAYAVYALAVATDHRTRTTRVRRWAWASAFGALLLGMAGQIAYHLLTPNARPGTPDWIVALVSCLPVLVLGAASLLWHLTGQDHTLDGEVPASPVDVGTPGAAVPVSEPAHVTVTVLDDGSTGVEPVHPSPVVSTPHGAPGSTSTTGPRALARPAAAAQTRTPKSGRTSPITEAVPSASDEAILVAIETATAAGAEPPSIRSLMRDHGIGQARATRIHRLATTGHPEPTTPTNTNDETTSQESPNTRDEKPIREEPEPEDQNETTNRTEESTRTRSRNHTLASPTE